VGLAVTLLKGADGRITLQVPVSRNINDPQFDFGQTIISAPTGVMKSVSEPPPSADTVGASSSTVTDSLPSSTATESSTSSIITGSSAPSTATDIDVVKGEDMRFIEFEFRHSELSAQATKKLDAFAKFLNERSALILGIEGTADRQMDLAKLSVKQVQKGKPGNEQEAAKALQKDTDEGQAFDDKQLVILALMRANEVKNYLIRKGKVDANRLQLKPAKIFYRTEKEHGRVELYLSTQ
jgi:outer membrane protein OmpA-like peptidoglycan-associated protein